MPVGEGSPKAGRNRSFPKLTLDLTGVNKTVGTNEAGAVAFTKAYQLEDCILGEGTASVVKRARRISDGLVVAVKCIRSTDEEHKQFAREEYALLKSLEHPMIVQALDCFEDSYNVWMCLECLDGGSLSIRVRERGCFSEADSRPLFRQLFQGVDYLHGKRIVHRDVKPSNLLLSAEGTTMKLGDFNSAKQLGESGMLTNRGTPAFSAPELIEGRIDWNERIDIWAIGMSLFFMLRGFLPFVINPSGAHLDTTYFLGVLDAIEWGTMSSPARDILKKCMSVEMRDRPSAQELLHHHFLRRCKDKHGTKIDRDKYQSNPLPLPGSSPNHEEVKDQEEQSPTYLASCGAVAGVKAEGDEAGLVRGQAFHAEATTENGGYSQDEACSSCSASSSGLQMSSLPHPGHDPFESTQTIDCSNS